MNATRAGIALGLACAGVIACGARSQKAAAPSAAMPAEAGALPASPRDQIAALDQQIDRDLAAMALPRPVVAPGAEPTPMATETTPPPSCPPPQGETCTDVCRLADSICTNAASICRIATTDLAGTDRDANATCQRATASCEAARQRCCGCT